jgi:serine/threonine-protein kinase
MGIVAVLLLVIGGAAYAIVLLGKSDKPKTIEVPSLVGQTQAAANQALIKLGFQPDNNPTNTSATCVGATGGKVAEGLVCTQDPAAHSKVTKDTAITFKLYKKPTKQVPQLSGLTQAQATDKLHQAGLPAPKVVPQNSDTVAQGLVIKSDPTAYTGVPINTVVTIYVSTGKSTVPTLIGKQLDAARQLLSQQGWTTPPQVSYRTTHDQSLGGVVLDQYPSPNTSYPKDTQITLTVWQYSAPGPTCTTVTTSPTTSADTSPPTSPSTSTSSPTDTGIIPPGNVLAPPTGTGTGTGATLPPCH